MSKGWQVQYADQAGLKVTTTRLGSTCITTQVILTSAWTSYSVGSECSLGVSACGLITSSPAESSLPTAGLLVNNPQGPLRCRHNSVVHPVTQTF